MESVIQNAQRTVTNTSQGHLFHITARNVDKQVRGRRNAVETAKSMSRKRGQVQLKRADDKIVMKFRAGDLQSYQYNSRRR